jgi:hypothetical protein
MFPNGNGTQVPRDMSKIVIGKKEHVHYLEQHTLKIQGGCRDWQRAWNGQSSRRVGTGSEALKVTREWLFSSAFISYLVYTQVFLLDACDIQAEYSALEI